MPKPAAKMRRFSKPTTRISHDRRDQPARPGAAGRRQGIVSLDAGRVRGHDLFFDELNSRTRNLVGGEGLEPPVTEFDSGALTTFATRPLSRFPTTTKEVLN
jgi:hypothetical protein